MRPSEDQAWIPEPIEKLDPLAPGARDRVTRILERYPHISEAETELVIGFLRKGRHLDVGLVTGDEALKPRIEAFMADHKRHLGVSIVELAIVLSAIFAGLTFFWVAWELAR
ncbi:MAG TPA: hypothetical protein VHE36_13990 [Sphingomicrobium sp.]|jgi:hypothetical protein|nr:hypothetical protein [Sphingomicrobium sp.]